jgi:hypothetical protein
MGIYRRKGIGRLTIAEVFAVDAEPNGDEEVDREERGENALHEGPVQEGFGRKECLLQFKSDGHDAEEADDDGQNGTDPDESWGRNQARSDECLTPKPDLFQEAGRWQLPEKASEERWLSEGTFTSQWIGSGTYKCGELEQFWEHPKTVNIEMHSSSSSLYWIQVLFFNVKMEECLGENRFLRT